MNTPQGYFRKYVKTGNEQEFEKYMKKCFQNSLHHYMLSCMKNRMSIESIMPALVQLDLSYKHSKAYNFEIWFKAVKKGRLDVLMKLVEYGAERYDEYTDENKRDSYYILTKFSNNTTSLTEIFHFFIDAGIPIKDCDHLKFKLRAKRARYTEDTIGYKSISSLLEYCENYKEN